MQPATMKTVGTFGVDPDQNLLIEGDGKTHSRLPHLKLGDNTSPNEVGRVYFAMDAEGERFIVDHVGLKLYGL